MDLGEGTSDFGDVLEHLHRHEPIARVVRQG
jgi:hypothetical protein